MNNKRIAVTLIANIAVFLANSLIGLLMTPYIVNHVGAEAYGFVTLATNFTNYANVIMLALNSMAGRFITIEFHRNNLEKANKYFTSILIANIIMTGVLLLPSFFCVLFIDKLVNISAHLVADVQILFATVFVAFLLTILGTAFSCSTFVANRKDLEGKRQLESYIIKAIVLILSFSLLSPHVYYVGISMLLMSIYVFITNIIYTKKLTPELTIHKKYFSGNSIKVLLQSGIWNSVENLSTTIAHGFDLLLANLLINPYAMGVLSIAKLLPNMVEMFIWRISAMFIPEYTIAYAESNKPRLLQSLHKTILIASIISNVCACMICVISKEFYTLWVPNEDAGLLAWLTVLTISSIFISAGIYCMYNLATVTNKIKIPAVVKLSVSILNIAIVLILLKTTALGVFAIAGVNAFTNTLMNLLFYIPYASRCIDEKFTIFFKPIVKNVFALGITVLFGFWEKTFFTIDNWFMLVAFGVILALTALIINLLICTTLDDKKQMKGQ